MTFVGVTDPFGAFAVAVFAGCVPMAAAGMLLRALSSFRRI